jgi:hypothetical protein
MDKTRVVINTKTRDLLKQIGTKGQTYDDIIAELLVLSLDSNDKDKTFSANIGVDQDISTGGRRR